jgi:hypothetical protein
MMPSTTGRPCPIKAATLPESGRTAAGAAQLIAGIRATVARRSQAGGAGAQRLRAR